LDGRVDAQDDILPENGELYTAFNREFERCSPPSSIAVTHPKSRPWSWTGISYSRVAATVALARNARNDSSVFCHSCASFFVAICALGSA
jgi:hypothetical protein